MAINTEIKTRSTITESIVAYLTENEDEFNEIVEELDSWDGYLGDDRYYSMDEFDELFHDYDPRELVERAFYGYDEDSYIIDKDGNKKFDSSFNPNRDYFRFNGYGNLVSTDYKDYTDHLDRYFVEHFVEDRNNLCITLSDELDELVEEYENAEG